MLMRLGSGSECDAQYLFSQDILGTNTGHIPRHARVYRQFYKEYERLQRERVSAYKEYVEDVETKNFNDPKLTVGIKDEEFEKFLKLAESE